MGFYEKENLRKLRWFKFINEQKSEQHMINKFKSKYGDNKLVIIGDVSGHETMRNMEATKGRSFRKLFKKHHYDVFLINEYRTSKLCNKCESVMEKFMMRENPRPWKNNNASVHGLLRCKNVKCLEEHGTKKPPKSSLRKGVKYRIYNRDLNAVLNMAKIIHYLRNTGSRPQNYTRNSIRSTQN